MDVGGLKVERKNGMKVISRRCIFSLYREKEKDLGGRGEEKPPANRKKLRFQSGRI